MQGVITQNHYLYLFGLWIINFLSFLPATTGKLENSHQMCLSQEISGPASERGVIRHTSNDRVLPRECTVKFSTNQQLIGLSHVNRDCSVPIAHLVIEDEEYCINQTMAGLVMFEIKRNSLTVILVSDKSSDFTIPYTTNVAVCGRRREVQLKSSEPTDLRYFSGIVASSLKPEEESNPSQRCQFELYPIFAKEPDGLRVQVLFDVVYLKPANATFTVGSLVLHVNKTSELERVELFLKNISILLPNPQDTVTAFIIKFEVLRCGSDYPPLKHGRLSQSRPWLLGTDHHYVCNHREAGPPIDYIAKCRRRSLNDVTPTWYPEPSAKKCLPKLGTSKKCENPPKPVKNTHYKLTDDQLRALFWCQDGYKTNNTVNEKIAFCDEVTDEDGESRYDWVFPPLKCEPIVCQVHELFNNIRNGNLEQMKTYDYHETLQYTCKEGFVKLTTSRCVHGTSWSATPACGKVWCPIPDSFKKISQGHLQTQRHYLTNDELQYTCNKGFVKTVNSLRCLEDGSWSSAPFCKIVQCEVPQGFENIANGNAEFNKDYHYLDTYLFQCDQGYSQLKHPKCQANGKWSATPYCSKLVTESITIKVGITTGVLTVVVALLIPLVVFLRKAHKLELEKEQQNAIAVLENKDRIVFPARMTPAVRQVSHWLTYSTTEPTVKASDK